MISVNIQELKAMFETIFSSNGEKIHTVFAVEGDSGVGKTAIISEAAKEHGFDLRLINANHVNMEDLFMPTVTDGKVQIKLSRLFEPAPDGSAGVMIFVDELSRPSSDGVGNAIMTMICERKICGVPLPQNFVFVTAYNPSESGEYADTKDVFEDLAARRRYGRTRLVFDHTIFLDYHRHSMYPDLYSFLSMHPESILVRGAINCPRQWERLSESMKKKEEWTAEDENLLMILSSTHMDTPTLSVWIKFWRGNLERFVSAEDLFSDWGKAKTALERHVSNSRMDMIEATTRSIESWLKDNDKLPKEYCRVFKQYAQVIPRAQARVFIDILLPSDQTPSSSNMPYPCFKDLYAYFGADKFGEVDGDPEFSALIIALG